MSSRTPLRYLLNFCDIDRLKFLAPIGDAVTAIWNGFTFGTDCTCCLGTRLILALAAAGAAGYGLASI